MRIIAQEHRIEVELSPYDVALFSNALNEVCHGLRIPEFELLIGAPRSEVGELFDKVRTLGTEKPERITATRKELSILQSAIRETLRRLRSTEFPIRTGVPFAFGEEVLRELNAYLG